MNCEDLNCSFCCILDEADNPICTDNLRICRFKTKDEFNELYIFVLVLLVLFYMIPTIYKIIEYAMIRPIYRDKSLYQWYVIKTTSTPNSAKKPMIKLFSTQKVHPTSTSLYEGKNKNSKKLTMLTSKVTFKTFSKYFKHDSIGGRKDN